MGVGGQYHAPAALPPNKTRYPLSFLYVFIPKFCTLHFSNGRTFYHQQFTCHLYLELFVHTMLTVTSCSALPVGTQIKRISKSETWRVTLREGHRLRVFENRVLRKMFGSKSDEVTGE